MENECEGLDWSTLPDALVIDIVSRLNRTDRGSLCSTSNTWRQIGKSPFLWRSLDIRAFKFDFRAARNLSDRCRTLNRLTFKDAKTIEPILELRAGNLKEIIGHQCQGMKDHTLSTLVARHPHLETLQLGPYYIGYLTSNAIQTIANSCRNIQKLRLSGISDVNEVAIDALASCCKNLVEIGLTDCHRIDAIALGRVLSLRFLSVSGSRNISWVAVSSSWTKHPNLVGLDVSRTEVENNCISMLSSPSSSLRVVCALNCPLLTATVRNVRDGFTKVMLDFNDMYRWLFSMGVNVKKKEETKFRGWRSFLMGDEKENDTIMIWLESVFAHLFLCYFQNRPVVTRDFWHDSAAVLLFSLIKVPQEDVAEIGLKVLSIITINREESNQEHEWHSKAVSSVGDKDIGFLLYYCQCHQEGLQIQATKAIANLSNDSYIGESIVRQGGIALLSNLVKSKNKLVVEEAAKGLYNLSLCHNYQVTFIGAGGIKALVEVLPKRPAREDVLENVAGALANLAVDKDCASEIMSVGGLSAGLELALDCRYPYVNKEALSCITNLSSHGFREHDYSGIEKAAGVMDSLVLLTHSIYYDISCTAVDALWTFCFSEGHPIETGAAVMVETFVLLLQQGNFPHVQQRVARFLWKLSAREDTSIAVGEGGIAALIALLQSVISEVRDSATGALCHLAFSLCNALHIKNGNGVTHLVEFCRHAQSRAMRFYSALALALMHDDRMVEYDNPKGAIPEIDGRLLQDKRLASAYISEFILNTCGPVISSMSAERPTSSSLQKQAEALYIGDVECFISSIWMMERLISLMSDSSYEIIACAAFALLQYITPCNIHWTEHTECVQKSGGTRVLCRLAASKLSPIPVKNLSKIVLFCLQENHEKI